MTGSASVGFGGEWTVQKLDILERYLNAYTTALKNQPFDLVYIDAFAGTGAIDLGWEFDTVSGADRKRLIEGSVARALNVRDRHFDHLVFVEADADKSAKLDLR